MRSWCSEIAAISWIALAGCSLTTVPRTACTPESCQATFGFGSVCVEGGYCRRADTHLRCEKTFPPDLLTRPTDYPDTIVFGSLMDRDPMTGANQIQRENAIELAIRAVNSGGGLEGRLFGVVMCNISEDVAIDGNTQRMAAVETATYLANELQLPAIIGPSASSDTQAVFEALAGTDTVVMSPASTAAALTDVDVTSPTDETPGLLWRTAPIDVYQAQLIVADLVERSVTSVAIVHSADTYGTGIAEAVRAGFTGTATLFPFDPANEFDRRDKSEDGVIAATGEVLFVSSSLPHIVEFIQLASMMPEISGQEIFLTDTAGSRPFLTQTMAQMSLWPSIRGSRPRVVSGAARDDFLRDFALSYTVDARDFSFTAQSYDAAWLLVLASGWALFQEGSISGRNLARGLRHVDEGTPHGLVSGELDEMVPILRTGGGLDVVGASGALDYDLAIEELTTDFEIWTTADLDL